LNIEGGEDGIAAKAQRLSDKGRESELTAEYGKYAEGKWQKDFVAEKFT